tara:strand:- start:5751 stop:7529 length:1779 start_codon:yes stop_codon:yes gene_type:complete
MANRGSSTAFRTEIVKDQSKPCHLIEVYLDSTHYVTDSFRDITYNSNTYSALGFFLGFDSIEESAQISASSMTLTLSGVDQTYTNLLLSQNYVDRKVIIRKAFINSSNALISSPIIIFDGRIDNAVINEDADTGLASVTASVANQFVDFEKVTGRYLNHQNQQLYYPGDKGLEYASEIVKDIVWGSEFNTGTREEGSGGLTGMITGGSFRRTTEPGNWSPLTSQIWGGILSYSTSDANNVTVNEAEHGRATGDSVEIAGAEGTGNVPASSINKIHTITVVNDNEYTFVVEETVDVNRDYEGGRETTIYDVTPPTAGIETQTTTNKQNYVSVVDPTEEVEVGDYIQLENTGTVGGIEEEKLTERAYEVKEVASGTGAKRAIIEVVEDKKTTAPPISTDTSTNNTITVNEADHGRDVGDTVVIAGSTDVGGVSASSINGTKTIAAIKNNNAYNVTVTDSVSSTVNYGGGNSVTLDGSSPNTPFVATTSGSTTVTFHHTAHGLAVGDTVYINGCNSVGGIPAEELNTSHTVASVPDANSFTVTVSTTATSTAMGGGAYTYVKLPVKATSAVRGGKANTTLKIEIAMPKNRVRIPI